MTFANGEYQITASGVDRAGNALTSNWENTNNIRTILVDNVKPQIANITIDADQDFNNTISFAENGDTSGDTTVNISVDFLLSATVETGLPASLSVASVLSSGEQTSQSIDSATFLLGGFTKINFNNVALGNGIHTLTINVQDEVGNDVDSTTNSKVLTVDTTAPGCLITGSRPNPMLANPVGDTVHDSDPGTEGIQYYVQVNTSNDNASIVLKDGENVLRQPIVKVVIVVGW